MKRSLEKVELAQEGPKRRCTHREIVKPDPEYFRLYSTIEIHREMLEDRVRTECYQQAINKNEQTIKDKVVLDVGMGTGILSYFAARTGAKKVYGIEACSEMSSQVKKIIHHNKLEGVVTVINELVENCALPELVDVIISEWMGYMLLYESMLDSVIFARDNFLKPGGKMLPSQCEIFLMPFYDFEEEENEADDLDFWTHQYGFDFSPIKPFVKACRTKEPEISMMPPHFQVAMKPCSIKKMNLATITKEEFGVNSSFSCSSMITGRVHGVAIWFHALFDTDSSVIELRTGPEDPETHWCQTLLRLTEPIDVKQDDAITGVISIQKSNLHPRILQIDLSFSTPSPQQKSFMFE